MKVISKLVNMDFKVGKIERDGDQLVIWSAPEQAMKVKVYLSVSDTLSMARAMLNFSVIGYVLSLPLLYFRSRKNRKEQKG